MALNIYNIKKWIRMLSGRSIEHVNQGKGKIYSISTVSGYYNDLTEKVTKEKNCNEIKLPTLRVETGDEIIFPIAVFQYGLGAYDLYLLKNKNIYLEKFKLSAEWTYESQELNGSWKNFQYSQPNAPYSAMAQGEAISILIRAYKEFRNEKYLQAARKAVEFMLLPIEEGGTTLYVKEDIFLQEFTNRYTVLNGWIFALFGIYDYLKVENDIRVTEIYDKSIQTMIKHMESFDNGYWSKYDNNRMIASPFYHKLHIAQLEAMYDITGEELFYDYVKKWRKYNNNSFKRNRAFLAKALQKIFEK